MGNESEGKMIKYGLNLVDEGKPKTYEKPWVFLPSKWDLRFMRIADLEVAQWSKDESSKVGCLIVRDREIVATGYNGMARGCNDNASERHERPEKYSWFVHAEPNAIINAARQGKSTLGCSMYLNWYPCDVCSSYIVQAGIKILYADQEPEWEHEKWGTAFKRAKTILNEGGVEVRYMDCETHRKGINAD